MIPCKHKFAVPARHGGRDGERRRGSEVDGGRGLVGKGPDRSGPLGGKVEKIFRMGQGGAWDGVGGESVDN